METLVEIEGCNGEWATIAGRNHGDQGAHLATDVKGAFFDPPMKVVYEEFANAPGSRFLNSRYLRRDITFAATIVDDEHFGGDRWVRRDTFWRKLWSFTADTKIHVTTDESGHRYHKTRLFQGVDVDTTVDPFGNTLNDALMALVSGDPFWYEDDVVYSAVTKLDTRYNPATGKTPPAETLTITVDPSDGRGGLNPTDQDIYLKWTIPGSQQPIPGLTYPFPAGSTIPANAPVTTWTIPDYSMPGSTTTPYDPTQATRALQLPGLVIGEDCVVNTDPIREQISSASGSQVWARMNGVRFRYPVPAYTRSATFTISVTGCAPGQMVTLRLPRPWSRPWGLE